MTVRSIEDAHQSLIKRPLSDDGLVGYTAEGAFVAAKPYGDGFEYHYVQDVRDKTCVFCGRGWELSAPSVMDQMKWEISSGLVHQSCMARFRGNRDRELFWTALVDARIRFRGLKEIPNQYWGPDDLWGKHQPWYEAELIDHPAKILIGSRKRVVHIEVEAQGGTKLDWYAAFAEAFKGEQVTKSHEMDADRKIYVHAWNDTKVKEYVKLLAELGGYANKGEAAE